MKKVIKKINRTKLIGIGIVIVGVIIGNIPFFISSNNDKIEENKIEEFMEIESQEIVDISEEKIDTSIKDTSKDSYSMVLEIPKIGLKKGLYNIDSKYNDVKYNVQILKESDMPNVTNGNLILASHRGNSSISYFNNLYKLEYDDTVNIYYENIKYSYKIVNSYETTKNGTITIDRDRDKNVIVLITCKSGTNNKQIVYIAILTARIRINGRWIYHYANCSYIR